MPMKFSELWTQTGSSLEQVVLAITLGAIIASAMMLYNKRVVGGFVRALLKHGANSEESALTLAQCGLRRPSLVRSALKDSNGALRRVVFLAGENAPLNGKNIADARFYITEEHKYSAEVRYDTRKTTVPVFILSVIVFIFLAYLCIRYIPQLLSLELFK